MVHSLGESEVVGDSEDTASSRHSRTDAIQAYRDCEQRAQSLSRLEPDKLPAWTTGNGRKVSALVKKLFKTGNSVEREFVFFNVQHWVVDQPHPGQAP